MSEKDITSVAEAEIQETQAILNKLDEAAWYYPGVKFEGPKAKSQDIMALLIQALVSKGVLSLADVERALK